MCGPYDRSYGMDLRRYISLVGLWLAGAVEPELAPLPNIDQPFNHQHDLCFMPCVAMVGVVVPPDVLAHLNHFIEPRQVTRTITINPQRLATAYLDRTYMVGGESTAASRNATGQFHPVTIHWRLPDGDIGWLRLICLAPVDATAEAGRLSIACHFDQVPRPEEDTVIFQIYAPNTDPATIQADCWHLPGLTITVKTTAAAPEVVPQAYLFEIVYALPKDKAATLHTFHLKLEAVHDPG
jgi:hypothetical protein